MRRRLTLLLATLLAATAIVATTAAPPAPAPAHAATGQVTVYRFWSNDNKSHFYTASLDERNQIIRTYGVNQWRYEGAAYTAFPTQQPGTVPLYRFFSQNFKGHFFTTDENEKNQVIALYDDATWNYEGVAFYVYPSAPATSDTLAVARFWSPDNRHHFYTADGNEAAFTKANYPANVWTYEGDNYRVPSSPANPAPMFDAKDCQDFPNWNEANAWFWFYYPSAGDIARLDGDNDGNPCESLPGAPR